jgi:hypothetical protein
LIERNSLGRIGGGGGWRGESEASGELNPRKIKKREQEGGGRRLKRTYFHIFVL